MKTKMSYLVVATALALLTSLTGCGGASETDAILMPDVTGVRLDIALSDIEHAGITEKVEVLGGGTFGVVDETNWQVCEQKPAAGEAIDGAPRLVVDRECGGEPTEDPTPTQQSTPVERPSQAAATPSPQEIVEEKSSSATATAAEMEATLKKAISMDISDLCGIDGDYMHWSCWYDGVEDGDNYLQVNLTTDGGWSDVELENLAATAGRHWFNFIACEYPDLSTIVVRVNGIDHDVYRWDTLADQMCD